MEFKINVRGKGKREFISAVTRVLAKHLKIERSRWTLEVHSVRGLKKNDGMKEIGRAHV